MGSLYYRCCWHRVSNPLFSWYRQNSSHAKAVYNPKAFFLHAASLDQAFAHCRMFLTAATRRCTSRVSVSSLGIKLSLPLPVIALVSRYLTNKLIGPRPLPKRIASLILRYHLELVRLSADYARLRGTYQGITNSFATISPSCEGGPFDLHALSTPPAFILSQDQTLIKNSFSNSRCLNYFDPVK